MQTGGGGWEGGHTTTHGHMGHMDTDTWDRRAEKTVKRLHMPCGDLGGREQKTVTEKSSACDGTQIPHPQSPNVSRWATMGPLGPPKESPSPLH